MVVVDRSISDVIASQIDGLRALVEGQGKELATIRNTLAEVCETVGDLRAGRTSHDPLMSAKDVWT